MAWGKSLADKLRMGRNLGVGDERAIVSVELASKSNAESKLSAMKIILTSDNVRLNSRRIERFGPSPGTPFVSRFSEIAWIRGPN